MAASDGPITSAPERTARSTAGDGPGARERIMLAGERLFAEEGLSVSVRAITALAGVNLASLHYYFGSKEGLLEAIFEARARPIVSARMAALGECVAVPGGPPLLEQIITAYLRPAFTLGLEPHSGGPAFAKLRARLTIDSQALARTILSKAFDRSSRAFLDALAAALPTLPPVELAWRFQFLLGTMTYCMADTGRIRAITGGACDPSADETALAFLVPFLAAGFRAPPVGAT